MERRIIYVCVIMELSKDTEDLALWALCPWFFHVYLEDIPVPISP